MNLEIFRNSKFEIRGGLINGEPYFVANDISSLLGYANTYAMLERLDDDEKTNLKDLLKSRKPEISDLPRIDGVRYDAVLLSESGLYNAILWSGKPQAKEFRRWITGEVLPAIRKHGGYLTPAKIEEVLNDPDTIIALAQNLKAERAKREQLEAEKAANAGYVSFAKSVEASVDSILIGNYAKLLSDSEGVSIGQNRLFDFLRASGYLISGGARHNVPYQKHIENGYFEVTTQTFAGSTGTHQKFTTKITGKGQIALAGKIVEYFKGERI